VHTETQKVYDGQHQNVCLGVIGPRADTDEKNGYCLPANKDPFAYLMLFALVHSWLFIEKSAPYEQWYKVSGLGLLQGQVCDTLVIPKGSWIYIYYPCGGIKIKIKIKSNQNQIHSAVTPISISQYG
jgi:hypothetical protein